MATIYLLCGLPGSGKTTYAKLLEQKGVMRLTLDEQVFQLFGRESSIEYSDREKRAKEHMLSVLRDAIQEGKDVTLDWGFWRKKERDDVRALIQSSGAQAQLLYFSVPLDELTRRIKDRDLSINHEITDEMLVAFNDLFEPPVDEGEAVIT